MKGLCTLDKSPAAGNSRRVSDEFIFSALAASAGAQREKVADILANCYLREDFSALSRVMTCCVIGRPRLRERDHAPRQ